MKICAIIAEFNPFHSGHKFIIEKIKQLGFTHIVVIMSGNFVQRGEPAVISKNARAEIALANGADLIIEIPSIWSLSTAEKYAMAGVSIANALGCAKHLAFGSECTDLNILNSIVEKLHSTDFENSLKNHLKTGIAFAKARELALCKTISDFNVSDYIKHPNNILAIEYLKAIKKLDSSISPIPILRSNSLQNSEKNSYCSASQIREMIINNNKQYENHVPYISAKIINRETKMLKCPCVLENSEQAILYRFKTFTKDDILALPDVNEGLENLILNAAKNATNLQEFLSGIKSKRYTMARIKRIILTGFLGITRKMQNLEIPYIKVLGMNKNGIEVLKKAKKNSSLPVIARQQDIKKLNKSATEVFETERNICDLYQFFAPKLTNGTNEPYFKIIKGDECDF